MLKLSLQAPGSETPNASGFLLVGRVFLYIDDANKTQMEEYNSQKSMLTKQDDTVWIYKRKITMTITDLATMLFCYDGYYFPSLERRLLDFFGFGDTEWPHSIACCLVSGVSQDIHISSLVITMWENRPITTSCLYNNPITSIHLTFFALSAGP